MPFSGGFTFQNFLADVFAIFMFVLWFWLFVSVASDLFRRQEVSGLAKVLWVIALVLLPYIGIFAYVLTQGRGMAERNQARAMQARDELRQAIGFSPANTPFFLPIGVRTASTMTKPPTARSTDACPAAARTSARRYPQVRARVAGR